MCVERWNDEGRSGKKKELKEARCELRPDGGVRHQGMGLEEVLEMF